MIVEKLHFPNQEFLSDIEVGGCFGHSGLFYIKTDRELEKGSITVVNLYTGVVTNYPRKLHVKRIDDARIVVEV